MTETFLKTQLNALTPYYPEREAIQILRLLLEDGLGLRWHARWEQELSASDQQYLATAVAELQQGKPIQYLTGKAHFYAYTFAVTPAVLIPRPETEELVLQALRLGQLIDRPDPMVLDVGTGSGCIALSLKKERAQWQITALDYSSAALAVARQNARQLHAEVDFRQMDFTDQQQWSGLEQYDLLLSNPPYIPFAEKHLLGHNVLGQEPDLALFVPDDDPLLFYRLLAEFGQTHLRTRGHLLVETNQYNATDVFDLMKTAGYSGVELLPDLMGNDRLVRAIKV